MIPRFPDTVIRTVLGSWVPALLLLSASSLCMGSVMLPAVAWAEAACDTDGDGLCDSVDPCPDDGTNDSDADGICAGATYRSPMIGAGDNCPTVANADQRNLDGDDRGDACDLCPADTGAAEDECLGTGVWEFRRSNQISRSESSQVAVAGKLYLIGGEQTSAGESVEIYDPLRSARRQ